MKTLYRIKSPILKQKVKDGLVTIQEAHAIEALEELVYATLKNMSAEGAKELREVLPNL